MHKLGWQNFANVWIQCVIRTGCSIHTPTQLINKTGNSSISSFRWSFHVLLIIAVVIAGGCVIRSKHHNSIKKYCVQVANTNLQTAVSTPEKKKDESHIVSVCDEKKNFKEIIFCCFFCANISFRNDRFIEGRKQKRPKLPGRHVYFLVRWLPFEHGPSVWDMKSR